MKRCLSSIKYFHRFWLKADLAVILPLLFVLSRSIPLVSSISLAQTPEPVRVYFEPNSLTIPPAQDLSLKINTGASKLAYACVKILFDQNSINLSNEIITTNLFLQKVTISPMNLANTSGNIDICLALTPDQRSNPVSGEFELAKLRFTNVTQNPNRTVQVTISDKQTEFVNIDPIVDLPYTVTNAEIFVNHTPPIIYFPLVSR